VEEGLDLNRDFNGARRDVGLMYSNVRNGDGSAPHAAISTPRCTGPASPSSAVPPPRRVVIHNHAVTGVEYTDVEGRRNIAQSPSVVLRAGTLRTPHLLTLSGIGPAMMAPSPIVTPGMMTGSRPIHTSLPMTMLPRLRIVGSSSAVRSSQVPLAQWKNADLLPLDTTARADIFRRVVGGGGEVIAGKGFTDYVLTVTESAPMMPGRSRLDLAEANVAICREPSRAWSRSRRRRSSSSSPTPSTSSPT
jgi:choline dehydrogenase-like flavoprotein